MDWFSWAFYPARLILTRSRGWRARTAPFRPRSYRPTIRVAAVPSLTLPPATHTNVYAVGSGEAVLIDPVSRHGDAAERLAGWVAEMKGEGLRFKALLLTHHHVDHAGGAGRLGKRLGLPVWAHAMTAARLGSGVEVARELGDNESIDLDGAEPATLTAVHTPGHAPGHLCFWERRRNVLFAGDLVASKGTIIVSPPEGDMAQYIGSLRRVRELGVKTIMPAHGEPIENPDALLGWYIEHRMMREDKVLGALVAHGGPARVWELVPSAYDDTPLVMWPFAERSAEAHLLKLLAEGKVTRTGKGWKPV